MSKHYKRIKEIRKDVEDLYQKGLTKGLYCGFENLYEYYSPKMGSTTYIYASPFSGKSEWWFEILISLSELYGYKHAIYSPETGTAKEIAAELISKASRKPFYKNMLNHIDEQEFYRYIDWVDEHFFIIDPTETDLTIEEFYEQVDEIEKSYDVKINTTMADPFNELRHNIGGDGRQDLYIENKLGMVRRNAQLHGRHNVLITHTASQELVKAQGKDGSDIYYNPPPNPNKLSGGMAWNRKAMNLIALWRPPMGLMNPETGEDYADNEVHVIIQKFKPKGTGKRGTVKFYFDVQSNRYYEVYGGHRRYSGKKERIAMVGEQKKYDF
jgi:twinkle protein